MSEGAAESEAPERGWTIAFTTASYVAREIGYGLDCWIIDDPVDPFLGGWRRCAAAVTEHFRPVSGFAQRFDAILADIASAGFEAVEIWGTHLSPAWATDAHVELAQESLARHHLTAVAYGADFGATRAQAIRACEIANALGAPILSTFPGPFLTGDRRTAIELVRKHGLRMAFENHPEHPTPEAFLGELGDDPFVGAIVDTGWWGTQATTRRKPSGASAPASSTCISRTLSARARTTRVVSAKAACRSRLVSRRLRRSVTRVQSRLST